MKSTNISSTIGRMPSTAAPVARPMNAVSEIGVSSTRVGPNLSSRPVVEEKMPPYAPTSSPSTMTDGSASISWLIASTIAFAVVSRRLVRVAVTVASSARAGEHVLAHLGGVGAWTVLGELHRPFDPGRGFGADAGDLVLGQHPVGPQPGLVGRDRIPTRHVGQVRPIALRVPLEVPPQPQRVHLDQRGAAAGAGPFDCLPGGRAPPLDRVALDPEARHAV